MQALVSGEELLVEVEITSSSSGKGSSLILVAKNLLSVSLRTVLNPGLPEAGIVLSASAYSSFPLDGDCDNNKNKKNT